MPGAFKLDHLQPFAQILFYQILQLFHFHAGRTILITPENGGLEMGKWISPNLGQAEDFECLGHSNWTICTNFISQILQLYHFQAGRPILITPERRGLEMGKWISPNLGQAEDF